MNRLLISTLIFLISISTFADTASYSVIDGIPWIPQTWNNCGPANLAMVMQYWGLSDSQQDIADLIRPHYKDPHADIHDMAAYARSRGLNAGIVGNAGLNQLKGLIAAGSPVIAPTWHVDEDGQEMGHYRTVYGYDEDQGLLFLRDSLEGPEIAMDEANFDYLWSIYNRPMLLVVPGEFPVIPDRDNTAAGSGTEGRNPEFPGLSSARISALTDFSRAVILAEESRYREAVLLLEKARSTGLPWRIWWYQPRVLEAYRKTGDFQREIDIILGCLNPYPYSEELFFLLALAYDGAGETDSAINALGESLSLRPGWLGPDDLAEFSPAVREAGF